MKSWTVKELIAELKCYEEDIVVVIEDGDGSMSFVEEVELNDELQALVIR